MAVTGSNRELKGTDLDPFLNGRCLGTSKNTVTEPTDVNKTKRERKQKTLTLPAATDSAG